MATLRELKGRIGSVASSEKITGAMKMISSAKMHKAEGALQRLVPFRSRIETIIGNVLSSDVQFSSPIVTEPAEVKHLAVVVWGSDDGLCGAYNVNIYKRLVEYIKDLRASLGNTVAIDIMPIGRKMARTVSALNGTDNIKIVDAPQGIDSKSEGAPVNDFMKSLENDFLAKRYDRIDTLYMKFFTAGRQRPVAGQLLPVLPSTFEGNAGKATGRPYLFEPSPNAIFNSVLPMFLMAVMQDIFTENRASEQASRIMAMQAANDNAKKLLESLQLEYNKLRQQSITNELLDIVGGQVRD